MTTIIVKKWKGMTNPDKKVYTYKTDDPLRFLRACLSRDAKRYNLYNGELNECEPIKHPEAVARDIIENHYFPQWLCATSVPAYGNMQTPYKSYEVDKKKAKPKIKNKSKSKIELSQQSFDF